MDLELHKEIRVKLVWNLHSESSHLQNKHFSFLAYPWGMVKGQNKEKAHQTPVVSLSLKVLPNEL